MKRLKSKGNAELPKCRRPEDVGLSSERLGRIKEAFRTRVESGDIPGAVVLIARHGKLAFFEAFGYRDREKQARMNTDAIFRIASMTKPFTSVALMMLTEEGKVQIGYPVSQFLPEFKNLQVGVEKKGDSGAARLELQPAKRDITIHDLLRHTSGLTYGFFGASPVKTAYNDAKMLDPEQTNAEMVTKLSKLPLVYQPGTTWDYSMSTDVLGRVVEVVSGMSFDRFIAERISQPLGLRVTEFSVNQKHADRVAEPQVDPSTGKRPPIPDALTRPKWFSGGGGMVSTAADYLRFCRMLLNGGELDGIRLLSPKTIALMSSDHLPPGVAYDPMTLALFGAGAPTPEMGQGFGLGFAVRKEQGRNPLPGSVGDYYWGGAFGTAFWIDPQEQLIAILMMQAPAQRVYYRHLMRELVYQAVIR
jgi:CubicO group peptidase (beta-lactamase class C family)